MKFYTVPELADALQVNTEKVRDFIRDGELRAITVTQNASCRPKYRITEEDLRAFLDSRATSNNGKTKPKRRKKSRERVTEFIQ